MCGDDGHAQLDVLNSSVSSLLSFSIQNSKLINIKFYVWFETSTETET